MIKTRTSSFKAEVLKVILTLIAVYDTISFIKKNVDEDR